MYKTKNKFLVIAIFVALFVMTIGFAYMKTNLNINGTSQINSEWKISIIDARFMEASGEASNKSATYTNTSANFAFSFNVPGDSVKYQVTVKNEGTIDAVLDAIKVNLDPEVIEYEVENIEPNEALNHNQEKVFYITFTLNRGLTSLPEETSFDIGTSLVYVQEGTNSNFTDEEQNTNEELVINNISLTQNESNVNVFVNASGASKYYYSLDNKVWFESNNNTYTFTNLDRDTEYAVYVKVEDSEGNVIKSNSNNNITLNDATLPNIYVKEKTIVNGENNWKSQVVLEIEATDNNEVNKIKYCVSSSTCTPTTEATLTNGIYNYTFSSSNNSQMFCALAIDASGNESETKCSNSYYVDNIAPTVTFNAASINGENGWYKSDFNVTVSGTDNVGDVAKIKYCTTTSTTCTPNEIENSNSVDVLINTESTTNYVCVTLTDNNGNESDTECSGPYQLDKNSPSINFTDNVELSVSETSFDIKNGVTYSDNFTATSNITINSPTGSVTLGTVGTYTITYSATDEAGNTSTKDRTIKVVDDIAPTVTFSVPTATGNNGWYKENNFDITVNTSDVGGTVSTIMYCTGTSECTPTTSVTATSTPVTVSTNSRTNYVCAYAIDNANNTGDTECSGPHKLDKEKPSLTIPADSTIDTNVTSLDLDDGVSATDNLTSTVSITKTGTVSLGIVGTYIVTYTATDDAGNSTSKTRTIIVESSSAGDYIQENGSTGLIARADGSFYYAGATPTNYIEFNCDDNGSNCETWRIMGTDADGNIKIIRDSAPTGYTSIAWDAKNTRSSSTSTYCTSSNGCNAWASTANLGLASNATYTQYYPNGNTSDTTTYSGTVTQDASLNTKLNNDYYNSLSSGAKAKIITHDWYVSSPGNDSDTESIETNEEQEKLYVWSGKVGLMTVSEYMRASTNSACTTLSVPYNNNCSSNNWLFQSIDEWTLSPDVYSARHRVWHVTRDGYLFYDATSYTYGARPVLYLSSDIDLEGEGTSDSPFTIKSA